MLTRPLACLTYAALATITAVHADNRNGSPADVHTPSLRGEERALSSLDILIPLNDTRRTTDPLSLAIPKTENEHESDGDEETNPDRHRDLGNNKRQYRNANRDPNYTKACSGARPKRCGCKAVSQSDYRGSLSITQNGLNCRAWTQAGNYPNQGLEDGSVCRNPDALAGRTWCFVDHPDVLWDYCEVKECDDDEYDDSAFDYSGYESTTGNNVGIPGCVTTERYYEIGNDIANIADSFTDDRDRSHFVGGVVRLAAHDFMDYDTNDLENPMGMDGCLDWNSNNNAGLNTIWNEHSPLFHLHEDKYRDVSRADFWVMAANAVIRLTSIGNALDLKPTFYWGRKEADACAGAAERLPSTESCLQVEGVFLQRMGMKWKDAVALLGAHTLGRGHSEFSGHHGTWMPNDKKAQVFDKQYYQELVARAWTPRVLSEEPFLQDWTTGPLDNSKPKMMLNTDVCLFYDVQTSAPCCTRADITDENGASRCNTFGGQQMDQCALLGSTHPRWEAAQAVRKYLGGSGPNENNDDFYQAFKLAWYKATINGMDNLKPLMDTC